MNGLKRRIPKQGRQRSASPFGKFEWLEDRRVLATFTVTSGFDTGVSTNELRAAIFQSNNSPGHDTIVFAPHISTINLLHGELDIIDDLTIDGSMTLDGSVTIRSALSNARIFNVDDTDTVADISVTMNGLILSGGSVVGAASNAGGAIRNVELVRLQNTVITDNRANFGGGIANYGAMYLDRVTIEGNEATQDGGGIFAGAQGSLELERVTISNNVAGGHGGGLALRSAGTRLIQTTIADNSAGGRGGGIYVDQVGGPLVSVAHSTVSGNSAVSQGGGIHSATGTVELNQTIVAGNSTTAIPGTPDVFGGANLVARYSLIGNRLGSTFTEAAPDSQGNLVGGPTGGTINPRLQPLSDNGGGMETMMLLTGSPAINAGDPAFSTPPSFDQRGAPFRRVTSGRIDIGALEYSSQGPDFDGNGVLDCGDVDELVLMIATGSDDPRFDLTGDGQVDIADLTRWLEWAGSINLGFGLSYLGGDANLDGSVDGSDFGVWNANKFGARTAWCQGDFNADGFVDGSDFGVWNANKFTSSVAMRGKASRVDASVESHDRAFGVPRVPEQVRPPAMRREVPIVSAFWSEEQRARERDDLFAMEACWGGA